MTQRRPSEALHINPAVTGKAMSGAMRCHGQAGKILGAMVAMGAKVATGAMAKPGIPGRRHAGAAKTMPALCMIMAPMPPDDFVLS